MSSDLKLNISLSNLVDLIDCNMDELNNDILMEKPSTPATEPNEAPAIVSQPEATTPKSKKRKLVPDCKGTLSVSKNDAKEMKFKRSKIEKAVQDINKELQRIEEQYFKKCQMKTICNLK